MYLGTRPETGDPSCSGFGPGPLVPCGKNSASPVPPLTLATILYSGAVPPPTAQVAPRLLLDLFASIESSASTASERTGS